jgi:hypothetical protein
LPVFTFRSVVYLSANCLSDFAPKYFVEVNPDLFDHSFAWTTWQIFVFQACRQGIPLQDYPAKPEPFRKSPAKEIIFRVLTKKPMIINPFGIDPVPIPSFFNPFGYHFSGFFVCCSCVS